MATGARSDAFATEAIGARIAAGAAVIAKFGLALCATRQVVGVNRIAAASARHTVPIIERDVGTCRVVGFQDSVNDREEIIKAAFLKSPLDCRRTITLAERVALDMGMRGPITSSISRGHGQHLVRPRVIDSIPSQNDLEASQVDTLQNNLFSATAKLLCRSLDHHIVKLLA